MIGYVDTNSPCKKYEFIPSGVTLVMNHCVYWTVENKVKQKHKN